MSNSTLDNNLFSSLISDIKEYNGKDPLLPWLRGIRKMRDSIPADLLKQKLPRFLQKCAQTFQIDRRYKNDLRYLRVWLQLMDFVDDPVSLLRTMEANHIGRKRSLFYQAYALYYEKMKKFEEAEKMYHLGVKNLAEPINELQESFEQFLHRMEQRKNKKIQRQGSKTTNMPMSAGSNSLNCDDNKENNGNICRVKGKATGNCLKGSLPQTQPKFEHMDRKLDLIEKSKNEAPFKGSNHNGVSESDEHRSFSGVDTVLVKFVDTAIVGKSEAEDARHHGLVEPTINTKEAMNAINNMFREPLEPAFVSRKSRKNEPKGDQSKNNGFEVFIDEKSNNGVGSLNQKSEKDFQEPFEIYIDDEKSNETNKRISEKNNFERKKVKKTAKSTKASGEHVNAFVFPNPKDQDMERQPQSKHREDTIVYRFVGSTISDEPKVENVCHHGLVEPTVNLKEAMDDINNMFGQPIEFTRKNRPRKQEKAPEGNGGGAGGSFLILADDDLDHQQGKCQLSSSFRNESDLFEPTVCTKEALDDINKMFGMPLDF